jgi:hypothetical protein
MDPLATIVARQEYDGLANVSRAHHRSGSAFILELTGDLVGRLILRAALPLVLAFGVLVTPIYAAGPNPVTIQIHDECDPATFNVAIGPGTCVGNGAVTFAGLLDEVMRLQRAPQWQFVPAQRHVRVGQSFVATNMGGETHTFAEVKQFGGGIVPFLNAPAGATRLAPECTDGTPDGTIANGNRLLVPAAGFLASIVPPGGTFTDTESAADLGHPVLYQCCIHPWMHEVITVDP